MRKITKPEINIGGYAILELLLYTSFFAVLVLVVINAMIVMTQAFRETTLSGEWVQSGVVMERIAREIRSSCDVSLASGGDLKLNTKNAVGAEKTVEFLLSGSNVQLLENNIFTGNLNAPNIIITNLTFTQITTTEGKAVRVLLTLKSGNDKYDRPVDFYDTVTLRGSY